MSITSGRSTVELYHPDTDENYTFSVDWTYHFTRGQMYMSNGDPGYPDEEDLDWTATLTHIEGAEVKGFVGLPAWVTAEMIEEEIDLSDIHEPDYD